MQAIIQLNNIGIVTFGLLNVKQYRGQDLRQKRLNLEEKLSVDIVRNCQ
jgi:hypothetical protein